MVTYRVVKYRILQREVNYLPGPGDGPNFSIEWRYKDSWFPWWWRELQEKGRTGDRMRALFKTKEEALEAFKNFIDNERRWEWAVVDEGEY